jgi:hypothetical protein
MAESTEVKGDVASFHLVRHFDTEYDERTQPFEFDQLRTFWVGFFDYDTNSSMVSQ